MKIAPAQTEEIEITDLARGGSGVARDAQGRVIFVPFTAPGDRVRVEIVFERKNYAEGRLVELMRASSIRQVPPCPLFGKCGGCQWQHLPYGLQWKTKASGARHALSRIGVAEGTYPCQEFPAEQIWEYRNRIQLRGAGREIGFFAAGSHDLVPASRCEIARPEINEAWELTREEGAQLPQPYKVELAVGVDGALSRVWNARHGAAGFRQIHDAQNEKLRTWLRGVMTPGRGLLDLFGGSGNLCGAIADRMGEVHCVDRGAPRVRPAELPENIRFHSTQVVPWLIGAARKLAPGAWSAICDPPREGLGRDAAEVIRAFDLIGVKEFVAVGCDPDSWARDVSRFLKRGWRLEQVAVFDFFPQTPHVESAAFLKID